MVHLSLEKKKREQEMEEEKMQMFWYVFRPQKTEVTSNISRNVIALCVC